MNIFRRRRKERRLPENATRREVWDREHSVTDPALKINAEARAKRVIDRANEVSKIASVVMIRTRPRRTAGNQ